MKREDFEKNLDLLSFDEIEEDDFMLNTPTREKKDLFDLALDFIEEDNIVDTKEEQDLLTEVELDEIIELPKIDVEVLEELEEKPEVMVMPSEELKLEEPKKEKVKKEKKEEEIEIMEIDIPEDDNIELKEVDIPLPVDDKEKVKVLNEIKVEKPKVRRTKEEREAYVLATLKDIKRVKDDVIAEVKLKKLSAETRISLRELRERLEELPKPRKVSSKMQAPTMGEAKEVEPVETLVIEEPKKEEPKKEEVKEETKKAKKEKVKKEKTKKEKNKPEKDKKYYCQLVFVIISILFILGCCIFYGSRLIKYYKIYNPTNEKGEKVDLLGSTILANTSVATEGNGLYKDSVNYVFKGNEVDNYVKYKNQLWRIIKVYQDGSTEMVLDSAHNILMFNSTHSTYKDSDIKSYLNDFYIRQLDVSDLANVVYCEDIVNDVTKITCDKSVDTDYVRLLGINDFINSKINEQTFINVNENVWLYNTSDDKVWNTNGTNISNGDANSNFLVKPVIRLKNSMPLLGGKGTKENPYVVDNTNKEPQIGSVVKLGEDTFNIIKIEDKKAYIALNKNINTTFRFDTGTNVYNPENASSAASYLNNSYLNSLSYKDSLVEGTFYTGAYTTSYKDVTKSKVNAKVGMLSILDPQVGSVDSRYYLITGAEDGFAYYNNYGILSKSKITISREIRPVLVIELDKLKVGEGTMEVPYSMEA